MQAMDSTTRQSLGEALVDYRPIARQKTSLQEQGHPFRFRGHHDSVSRGNRSMFEA